MDKKKKTKKPIAILQRFGKPIKLSSLKQLAAVQNNTHTIRREEIVSVAKLIPGFDGAVNSLATSDGYHWYIALYFAFHSGSVAILFPWGIRDDDIPDAETGTDERPISAYTTGSASVPEIEYICNQLRVLMVEASR